MRIKNEAFRSLEQANYDSLINFCCLPNYKLTLAEKKFAEKINIPNKLMYEVKKIYNSKGKAGLKNFFKQRKMITKGHILLEFLKGSEM